MSTWPTNFSKEEFERSTLATRYGIDNTIPPELIPNALQTAQWCQTLRNKLSVDRGQDTPLYFSSAYRSPRLNKKARGSKTSVHMKALAIDAHAVGMKPRELFLFIYRNMKAEGWDQLILEHNRWVHVGLRPKGVQMRGECLAASYKKTLTGKVKTIYSRVNPEVMT